MQSDVNNRLIYSSFTPTKGGTSSTFTTTFSMTLKCSLIRNSSSIPISLSRSNLILILYESISPAVPPTLLIFLPLSSRYHALKLALYIRWLKSGNRINPNSWGILACMEPPKIALNSVPFWNGWLDKKSFQLKVSFLTVVLLDAAIFFLFLAAMGWQYELIFSKLLFGFDFV